MLDLEKDHLHSILSLLREY